MSNSPESITAKKPKSVWRKPLSADFRQLFKSSLSAVVHAGSGKWEELAKDGSEILSAIGLSTEPSEVAHLLLTRALAAALHNILQDSREHLTHLSESQLNSLPALQIEITGSEVSKALFEFPGQQQFLAQAQDQLTTTLEHIGFGSASAKSISQRLRAYFIYAINEEWRLQPKFYAVLQDFIYTPFSKAIDREWDWHRYSALLALRTEESLYDEPFSISDLYVPLNAAYLLRRNEEHLILDGPESRDKTYRVVPLHRELTAWLHNNDSDDSIRVLSGGPGSGKSTFARIFAAETASQQQHRVLYIPLHLIDPDGNLAEEVTRFVRDEGILRHDPLGFDIEGDTQLLLIFDGLDELSSQGRASAETARAFIREVERTVQKRNQGKYRLRALLCGRELVIQENESEFRFEGQVLHLLPYYVSNPGSVKLTGPVGINYEDPEGLFARDLRDEWWKRYSLLRGDQALGMPGGLRKPELDELTAQPLLNFLIALSLQRGKIDFDHTVNLNSIYADLVAAVHERAYEANRTYISIRHMTLEDFVRVLEEIGLASWHGDSRSTTVKEIEEHCRASGVSSLLDVFQDGAKSGVTRLLAAFFFRRFGQRASGDPTFVFTHKTFGEYLTARRIIRGVDRMVRELSRRQQNPDEGWDEKEALRHWAVLCGPSPMTRDLRQFIVNEISGYSEGVVAKYQEFLSALMRFVLELGLPMEQISLPSHRVAAFQKRNAEETLMVCLNACALVTEKVSELVVDNVSSFGAWLKRIQGQRLSGESAVVMSCLSYINISGSVLHMADLYEANFGHSDLSHISAAFCCLYRASFFNCDLTGAHLGNSDLSHGVFDFSNFEETRMNGVRASGSSFSRCNFIRTSMDDASFNHARFDNAIIFGVFGVNSDFRGCSFKNARIRGGKFSGSLMDKRSRLARRSE